MLDILENTSLKVVKLYEVHRSFLFRNFKQCLWEPIVKVGKFIIAPHNYCPQCFDHTLAFRFITKPSKMGKILNIYVHFLIKIKIASIRPIFHYIPLMEKENMEIWDKYILLHLKIAKISER